METVLQTETALPVPQDWELPFPGQDGGGSVVGALNK